MVTDLLVGGLVGEEGRPRTLIYTAVSREIQEEILDGYHANRTKPLRARALQPYHERR
jgi:hypothetical protein